MAEEQTIEQIENQPSQEEVERKARDMGWQPKEKWKGNPDNWVDAPQFVKQGETFVPFLQHTRKKLEGDLSQVNQTLRQTQEELRQTRETLSELTKFNEEMARDRTERRKVELGVELKAAREAGDDVRVAELQNELGEVVKPAAVKAPPKVEEKPNGGGQPVMQPWVKGWVDDNKEFFDNPRKLALFNAVVFEKRKADDKRVGEGEGTDFLNEARDEVERVLGANPRRQAPSKTEESRNSGGSGNNSGGGKSYADLPPDARAKCDAQEAKFVGKGFKDQVAWRKHFAKEYFGPSAIGLRGE